MGLRIGSCGLSSLVGMVLILIALMLFSALTYSVLDMIRELGNLSLDGIEYVLVKAKVPYLVGGNYTMLNSTIAVIRVGNNLTEPLQLIGYVVIYGDMSFEVMNLVDRYVVPPLNTITLTLSTREKPLCVIAVLLVRERAIHIILKGS